MRKTKFNTKNILMELFALTLVTITFNTLIHPALAQQPRIYLDPSDNTYDESTPVGTKFNVTVWCTGVTQDIGGAQITLRFNDTIINVTRWWAPDWDSSFFMPAPITTIPAPPNPGYIHVGPGQGYVKITALKGGLPPTAPWGHNGTIAIIEFNITKGSPATLTSVLKINTTATYLLDSTSTEIPSVIKEDGSYTLIPEYTLIIALSLFIASTATVALLRKKRIIQKLN